MEWHLNHSPTLENTDPSQQPKLRRSLPVMDDHSWWSLSVVLYVFILVWYSCPAQRLLRLHPSMNSISWCHVILLLTPVFSSKILIPPKEMVKKIFCLCSPLERAPATTPCWRKGQDFTWVFFIWIFLVPEAMLNTICQSHPSRILCALHPPCLPPDTTIFKI